MGWKQLIDPLQTPGNFLTGGIFYILISVCRFVKTTQFHIFQYNFGNVKILIMIKWMRSE